MQLNALALIALTMASGTLARNCNIGLYYCGNTLMKIGNYQAQIDSALQGIQDPITKAAAIAASGNSIYRCLSSSTGDVSFQYLCGSKGCKTTGVGYYDYCYA